MRFFQLTLASAICALMLGTAAFAIGNSDYLRIRNQTPIAAVQPDSPLTSQFPLFSGQYIEIDGTITGLFSGVGADTLLLDVGEARPLLLCYTARDTETLLNRYVRVLACVPAKGIAQLEALAITITTADFATRYPANVTSDGYTLIDATDAEYHLTIPEENVNYRFASVPPLKPQRPAAPSYTIDVTRALSSQQAVVQMYADHIRTINARLEPEKASTIALHLLRKSEKYDVDPRLLVAMVTQESRFNTQAVSRAGARGLGQLMPGTAAALGVRDSFDIEQNLDGTARYIASQLDTFGRLSLALAAYNAGPGNVRKYGGVPPFRETQHYVKVIWNNFAKLSGLDPVTGKAIATY